MSDSFKMIKAYFATEVYYLCASITERFEKVYML